MLFIAIAAVAAMAVASGEASSKISLENSNEPETMEMKFSVRHLDEDEIDYEYDDDDELDDYDDDDEEDDDDVDFDDDDDDYDDDDDFDDDEDLDPLTLDDDDLDEPYLRKLDNAAFEEDIAKFEDVVGEQRSLEDNTNNKNKKKNRNKNGAPKKYRASLTPEERDARDKKRAERRARREAKRLKRAKEVLVYSEKVCKKLKRKFRKCKKKLKSKCKKLSKKKKKKQRKRCKQKKAKWKECVQWLKDNPPTIAPGDVPTASPDTNVTAAPAITTAPTATTNKDDNNNTPEVVGNPTAAPSNGKLGDLDTREPAPDEEPSKKPYFEPNPSASLATKVAIDTKTAPLIVEATFKVAVIEILKRGNIPEDGMILDVKSVNAECHSVTSNKHCFDTDLTITALPDSGVDPDAVIEMIRKAIGNGAFADQIQLASGLTGVVISPSASSTSHAAFDRTTPVSEEDAEAAYVAAIKSVMQDSNLMADDVVVSVKAVQKDCDAKYPLKKCFSVESTVTVSPTSDVDPDTAMKKIEKAIAQKLFDGVVEASSSLVGAVITVPLESSSLITTAAVDKSNSAKASDVENAYGQVFQEILESAGVEADNFLLDTKASKVNCGDDSLSAKKCFTVDSVVTSFPSSEVDSDEAVAIIKKAIGQGVFADKVEASGLTGAIISTGPSATSITTASVDPKTISGVDTTADDIKGAYHDAIKSICQEYSVDLDEIDVDVKLVEVDCDDKSGKKCYHVKTDITASPSSGVDPEVIIDKIEKKIELGDFADKVEKTGLVDPVISSVPSSSSYTNASFDASTTTGEVVADDVEAAYEAVIQSVLKEADVSPEDVFVQVQAVGVDCDASRKCFSVESKITPLTISDVGLDDIIRKIKKAVAQGVFANDVEGASKLTGAVITNAPSSTSVTNASFDKIAVSGKGVSAEDVNAAYEKAIEDMLKKASIKAEDVIVAIDAVEADCAPEFSSKKCFNVESNVMANPKSSADPDAIISKIKLAVDQGLFEDSVEDKSGLTRAIIVNAPSSSSVSNASFDEDSVATADDVETAYESAIQDILQGSNIAPEDVLAEVVAVEVDCAAGSSAKKCFKVETVLTAMPGSGVDTDSLIKLLEKATAQGTFAEKVASLSALTGARISATPSSSSVSTALLDDNTAATPENLEAGYEGAIKAILEGAKINLDDVFVEVQALETECEKASSTTKCFTVESIITASPTSDVDPETVIQKIEKAIIAGKFEDKVESVAGSTGTAISVPALSATSISSAAIDANAAATAGDVKSAYEEAIQSILKEADVAADDVNVVVEVVEAECAANVSAKKCFSVKSTVTVTPSSGVDPKDILNKIESAIAAGIFAGDVEKTPDVTGAIITNGPSSTSVTNGVFDQLTSEGGVTTADDVEAAYKETIGGMLKAVDIKQEDVSVEIEAIETECDEASKSTKKCFNVKSTVTTLPSADVDTDDIISKIKTAVDQGDFDGLVETGSVLSSAVITNAPSSASSTNAEFNETTSSGAAVTADNVEAAYEKAIQEILGESNQDILVEVEAVVVKCGAGLTGKKCFKVESILTASSPDADTDAVIEKIGTAVAKGDFADSIESSSDLTAAIISSTEAATSVSKATVDDNASATEDNLEAAYNKVIQSILKDANIKPDDVFVEVEAFSTDCKGSQKCFTVETIITAAPNSDVDPSAVIQKLEESMARGDFADNVDSVSGLTSTEISIPLQSASSNSNAAINQDSPASVDDIESAYDQAIKNILAEENMKGNVVVGIEAVEVECSADLTGKKCYGVKTTVTATPGSGVDVEDLINKIEKVISDGIFDNEVEAAPDVTGAIITNAPSSTSVSNASFGENSAVGTADVETAYKEAIKSILEKADVAASDVLVDVTAVEVECGSKLSTKKCYDVDTVITGTPSAAIYPDEAVDKIKKAISQGDFADLVETASVLTDAVITNAPSTTSIAHVSFDKDASASPEYVESSLEGAIKDALREANMMTNDVVVEVEALEVECQPTSTTKTCFIVESIITASPSTGVDPDAATEKMQKSIDQGALAKLFEASSSLTDAVMSNAPSSSSNSNAAFDKDSIESLEDVERVYEDAIDDILTDADISVDDILVEVEAVESDCGATVSANKKCFDVKSTITSLSTDGIPDDVMMRVKEAIVSGQFDDKVNEPSDMTGAIITIPPQSSSFDSIATTDQETSAGTPTGASDVEGAYKDAIDSVLKDADISVDDVIVEVEAVEIECEEGSSEEKCFNVKYILTASPTSPVDTDVAIEKVKEAIAGGIFTKKVDEKSDLMKPIVTLPLRFGDSISLAAVDANTSTGAPASAQDVKEAYKAAIKSILDDANIPTAGKVSVQAEAADAECGAGSSKGKKCFSVRSTIVVPPNSLFDIPDAIQKIEDAIENKVFENEVNKASDLTGAIISLPLQSSSTHSTATVDPNTSAGSPTGVDDVEGAYKEVINSVLKNADIDADDVSVEVKAVEVDCEAGHSDEKCFDVTSTITKSTPDSPVDTDVAIEKVKEAISGGIFAKKVDDESDLSSAIITLPGGTGIPSANTMTNAAFNKHTAGAVVEAAFEVAMEDILEEANLMSDGVTLGVEAVEGDCVASLSNKKCFEAELTVSATPSSKVDPKAAIKAIEAAIANGTFADKIGKAGLPDGIIALGSLNGLSAVLVTNASFDDGATAKEDVGAGYMKAIQAILDQNNIGADAVTFGVETVETDCETSAAGSCFKVVSTVTASPDSGVNPNDILGLLRTAIAQGLFENMLNKSPGLTGADVAVVSSDGVIILTPNPDGLPTDSPTLSPTSSWSPTTFLPKCQVSRRIDPDHKVDVLTAIEEKWIEATFNRRLENVRCVRCNKVEFIDCRDVECVETNSCTDSAFTSTADPFDLSTTDEMNVNCIGEQSCTRGDFKGIDSITCRGEQSCSRASVSSSYDLECMTDNSCSGLDFDKK